MTIRKGPFGTVPGPDGFETLRWPVGYSLSLAGPFKAFGATLTTAKVVNALAGAATVPLVFLLGRRLFDSAHRAAGGGADGRVPGAHHLVVGAVLRRAVHAALRRGAGCGDVRAGAGRWPQALAAGTAHRLREHHPADGRGAAGGDRRVLAAAVGAEARRARSGGRCGAGDPCLRGRRSPLWNSARTESPKLLSENLGYNLRVGHAPYATGRYVTPEDLWATVDTNADPSALPSESLATRRAVRYAATHPLRELELSAKKVFYLYTTDSDSVIWALTFGARRSADRRARRIASPTSRISGRTWWSCWRLRRCLRR